MSTETKTPGATEGGMINAKLANPLNARDLVNLGLDADTPAQPNDIITITRDQAASLIGAGYIQCDPEDSVAVAAYLDLANAPAPGVAMGDVEPVGTPGQADAGLLVGKALDDALAERDLSKSGTVSEKQERLAAFVPHPQS